MINQSHIDYVKSELARGVLKEDIAKALSTKGMSAVDVNEAFIAAAQNRTIAPAIGASPAPTASASPSQPVSAMAAMTGMTYAPGAHGSAPSGKTKRIATIVAVIAAPVLLGAAGVYAYQENLLPFRSAPYSEEDLFSGLLMASAGIETATYSFTGSLVTEARDEGAEPYEFVEPSPDVVGEYKPEPFLVQVNEMARYLPSEMNASIGITAKSDFGDENANFEIMMDATGDFGDLTYKVNAEARKAGELYYFRINNLPSLFLGELDAVKGMWVAVDPADEKTNREYGLASLSTELPEMEENYREKRAAWAEFMMDVARLADEHDLVSFKNAPRTESVGDRRLFRYDLAINKESVLPFFKAFKEVAGDHDDLIDGDVVADEKMLEYLESEEFENVFAYLDENMEMTLWVDGKGRIAGYEYRFRLVPPDTATQLKDKQGKLTLTWMLNDINKSLDIEAPEESKPLSELSDELAANRYGSVGAANDAKVQELLQSLRISGEIFYSENNNRYATASFTGASPANCTGMSSNFFGDDDSNGRRVTLSLSEEIEAAHCAATSQSWYYAATLPSDSGKQFCVDSTGWADEFDGTLAESHTATACRTH
ncbi:MAG: hypothetical protein KBC38_01155 [Candidatus Pacebacteria bacterium]|nr:hypothetical protein [Candidatus Paceibacterota bacterium]MBP9840243.1 hypothetical protein [Candidatus Paceibacterota bacterium]